MKNEHDPIRDIDITKGQSKPKYEPLHPTQNASGIHPLAKTPHELIVHGLKNCPIGDGSQFENIVLSTSLKIFGKLVDGSLVRQQIPIQGGFADIELPFCLERLAEDKYRCWEPWQRDYAIKSMLVEVKNLQEKATHKDANQLKGYVDGHSRGRLAFLVSRTGFTKSALTTLSDYHRNGYLLLPLDNNNLLQLITSDSDNPKRIMQYLRRLSEMLLRIR
jgi:hypothetical protein